MAEEFRIDVPFGGRDELTPVIDRAERRFRRFRNNMRRETAAMRRDLHMGFGGAFIGPSPAGRPSLRQQTQVQRASARFQRFQGGSATSGLLPMAGSPQAQRGFTSFLRQTASSMRQIAPLTTRAFGAVNAATQTMMRGGAQAYYRAFGSIGVGGGLSRAFGPINAIGRGLGTAGRVAGGVGGAVRGGMNALRPSNLFSAAAAGYLAYNAGQAAFGGPLALAGQMEQANITFETLLGNAEKARSMLDFLFKFAERTPLQFGPIREWGQQLLQWGFSAERIPELMNAIASAASAMPDPEVAGSGITRALGQMRLRGRVLMEEINQLQDQGVPALEMLAKGYGVTTNEIINWMERGVRPAVLAGKQLRGGIDIIVEGLTGRYGNMLERQSKTLLGLWSTIKDIVSLRFVLPWGQGLAEGVQPVLMDLVDWFEKNKQQVADIGQMIKEMGAALSGNVASGIRSLVSGLSALFGSPEWKNAKTFGEQFALISGKVGELLWGNQQGQAGLVQGVMEWIKGQTSGILVWAQAQWTRFSDHIGGILQTWTTWTAERINELKAEAFKRFGELVDYFKTTFQNTIVSALQSIIPWYKPPGGGPGAGASAAGIAGMAAAGPMAAGARLAAEFFGRLPVTSPFMKPNGISFGGGPHRGVDFSAPAGTNIISPVSGTFGDPRALGLSAGYGRAVVVIDDKGNTHIFGHTASGALGPLGGPVVAGQTIATVGALANKAPGEISTGTHIHYEIREMGDFNRQVNPSEYLNAIMQSPVGASPSAIAAEANQLQADSTGNVHVHVDDVHVDVTGVDDPAAVSQAVADGFAASLAGSLEGAFANMPRMLR